MYDFDFDEDAGVDDVGLLESDVIDSTFQKDSAVRYMLRVFDVTKLRICLRRSDKVNCLKLPSVLICPHPRSVLSINATAQRRPRCDS